jgi:hypothetical protein
MVFAVVNVRDYERATGISPETLVVMANFWKLVAC